MRIQPNLLIVLLLCGPVTAFHDSLNFIVAPRARQCFYEDFADSRSVKTIDLFVQSGGKNAIEIEVGAMEWHPGLFVSTYSCVTFR